MTDNSQTSERLKSGHPFASILDAFEHPDKLVEYFAHRIPGAKLKRHIVYGHAFLDQVNGTTIKEIIALVCAGAEAFCPIVTGEKTVLQYPGDSDTASDTKLPAESGNESGNETEVSTDSTETPLSGLEHDNHRADSEPANESGEEKQVEAKEKN